MSARVATHGPTVACAMIGPVTCRRRPWPPTSTPRCRLTGEFTLRSGQVAHRVLRQVPLRDRPGAAGPGRRGRWSTCCPTDTELLGGLELGGIPIATMLSSLTGLPALFVRKKAKEYGTCKLAEGPDVAGRRVTLVEDVITTGGAVRDATRALRDAGAIVEVVVCAIDRSPAGREPARRRRARGAAGAHQGRAGRRPRLTQRRRRAGGSPASRGPAAGVLRRCPVGDRRRRCRRLAAGCAVAPPLVGDRDRPRSARIARIA